MPFREYKLFLIVSYCIILPTYKEKYITETEYLIETESVLSRILYNTKLFVLLVTSILNLQQKKGEINNNLIQNIIFFYSKKYKGTFVFEDYVSLILTINSASEKVGRKVIKYSNEAFLSPSTLPLVVKTYSNKSKITKHANYFNQILLISKLLPIFT